MVNVQSRGARIKFVDHLTVVEVVPRNPPSLVVVVCKSLTADFLHYNSCVPRPIAVGGSHIKQVSTFKLLVSTFKLLLSEDLTWAVHCDYMVKKANRRLYALRQLEKCKVPSADIVHIYCVLIRSILGYAFARLPKYLAC